MAQRFVNPYAAARTDLGAGIQNLMQALYSQKASTGAAAHRTPAQDVKDTADAAKAQAEADQINRVENGVRDYVPNFTKSLVPENEVPLVQARSQTGIWPSFEDPRRQQSVVEGVGPVDWSPEKDASLRDAQQISAALLASKEANFKDLNSAQQGPASNRQFRADIQRELGIGGEPAAVAPADTPTLGLPSAGSGSRFLSSGGGYVPPGPAAAPAEQPTIKPMATTPIDMGRPIINNPDGSFSTERTITIEADGKQFLIPTIVNGQQLTPDEAVQAWRDGRNNEVGVFNSPQEAEQAAVARSQQIGSVRGAEAGVVQPAASAPTSVTAAPQHNIATGPDLTTPPVTVSGKKALDTDAIRRVALLQAGGNHEAATALTGIANSDRMQQEEDRKQMEFKAHRKSVGPGLSYDDQTKQYYIAGSDTPATAAEISAFEKSNKGPLVAVDVNSFDKTGGAERARSSQLKQDNAYKAQEFAGTVKGLATALEGYGGGPLTEFQAKIGRYAPESEYGRISSIEDLVNSVRTKLATTVRATGSGATSDFEMRSYLASIPGLANTPDGRKLMAEIAQRIADRESAAADIYQELAQKGPVKSMEWRRRVRDELGDLLSPEELQKMNGMTSGARVGAPAGGGKPWERKWGN